MQKVLVIGGAGERGAKFCEKLINEGRDVVCVDTFKQGYEHITELYNGNRHRLVLLPFDADREWNLGLYSWDEIYFLLDPVKHPTALKNMEQLAEKANTKVTIC